MQWSSDRNAAVTAPESHAVRSLAVGIADADVQVTDDDVPGPERTHAVFQDADAVPGCRLSGDIDIAAVRRDGDAVFQLDDAAHTEDHDARSFFDLERLPERALAGVVEIGDVIDAAGTAARGKAAPTLSAGKSQLLCTHRDTHGQQGKESLYSHMDFDLFSGAKIQKSLEFRG